MQIEAAPPLRVPVGFRVALAAAATVFALGLCELGARYMYPAPPDPTRQPQVVYRYDPEIRYVPVPSQQGWIDDGFVTVNALGFRGRETAVPKPAGRFRIVTVGDSLTQGFGVGDDETYSAQLEQLLHKRFPDRDLEVVNIGVSGYDTRQEVTFLKRHLATLEPDLVLVGFYSNDVPDGLDDERALAASGTRIAASQPETGQILHMNPTPSSWWEAALRRSRAAYTVGRTLKRLASQGEWGSSRFSMEIDLLQGKDSPELDQAWAGIERQLGELRAAAAGRFSVGMVVLPCREQVTGQFANARYQSRVQDIAGRLGFFVVDPLPALIASNSGDDDLYIAYDRNHPSAAGHRVIGESIVRYFEQHPPDPSLSDGKASRAPLPAK